MTSEDLEAIVGLTEAKRAGEWRELPEGRLLTLHLASNGVGLTVAKITQLRNTTAGQLHLRTARDETYVVALADVFAAAFEDSGSKARKAGFM